ncbi:hypothetical protein [Faecalibacter sp. LW9]|uniref:hypothetical protein n=1 Tax=Faecalibacter sp. LW9 TaxID=3103144 RepID=UPI002AFF5100|nr:hypothetical protein [Faecalibacter sp. LW9]
MKHLFTLILFTFTFLVGFGQINEKDSLVNVKAFWNVDDTKKYRITTKEIRKTQESTAQEEISYRVNIKVENIFEDERTISWFYSDVNFNSDKFVNNPLFLVHNIPVKFVVDADGRFLRYEDLNATLQAFILSAEKIQNKYIDDEETFKRISDLAKRFANKENIMKIFEKDIRQFHLFFGTGEFIPKMNALEFNSYIDNLFTNAPTPAKTTIKLNEIAFTGTNYIMQSYQEADKEWLANSWYNYLKELAEKLGSEAPDESHLNDEIIYNVTTNSRIKDNGWISYSIETKKVNFQDTDYTLERRIELE